MTISSSDITVNSNIRATKSYFDIYGKNLTEISATTNGDGGGNNQAYVWAYQDNSDGGYAEAGSSTGNSTSYSTILHRLGGRLNISGFDETSNTSWNYDIKPYGTSNSALAIIPVVGDSPNTWIFDGDGSLTIPGTINLPTQSHVGSYYNYSSSGRTLRLSDDKANQVYITGPSPDSSNPATQRIVIQGQRGFGTFGQSIAGEGGDVYLWAGVGGESDAGGGTGGDIKIRGGQGQDNEGGYVKIEAGDAAHWGSTLTGNGGFIEITAGSVTNSGGDANNVGGDITISAGRAKSDDTKSGAVKVRSGGSIDAPTQKEWLFDNQGTLTLPDHGKIIFNTSNPEQYIEGTMGFHIRASDVVVVDVANNYWNFTNEGKLELPGAIGTAANTGNVVIMSSNGTSEFTWTFDNTGRTTLPIHASSPGTARGNPGDKAGMFYITGAYIFYCYADYTDGSVPIWQKASMDNTDWD
jgi:hypothetical protein